MTDVTIKVGLHIEQDPTVPVPLIQLASEDGDVMHVVATNYEPSANGARAIAETLAVVSGAIYAELVKNGEHGRNASEVGPAKPKRFNPRPVVGK